MIRQALIVIAVVEFAASCQAPGQPVSYPYRAAIYMSVAGVSQDLEVFPFDREAFRIPMPFPLDAFAYSPDGKALYAAVMSLGPGRPRTPGLFKIEFNPTRVSLVPGSAVLGFNSLAVSARQDKIFVAGGRRGTPCGIFELSLPAGDVRTIVDDSSCNPMSPLSSWSYLSLSPDGVRATALGNHHLELIDLVHGKVTVLPDDLTIGAWSPDGKWLAAVGSKSDKTILLDARTLIRRRAIGSTDLRWSPDSRYLLARKGGLACGPEIGTLEIVDIESGKRTEIKSSRCQIDTSTTGWVSSGIAP
jgi:WD40 repeat protein